MNSSNIGWECPKCGRVNAPWVSSCPCYCEGHLDKTYPIPSVPSFPYPSYPNPQWPIITCGGNTTVTEEKDVVKFVASPKDIVDGLIESPIPLEVFPNQMGINLCSVDKLSWDRQSDGQLRNLSVFFNPKTGEEKG